MKHLDIDFTKYVQDLYAENKKILMKEIKESYAIFVDWENQFCSYLNWSLEPVSEWHSESESLEPVSEWHSESLQDF